MVLAYFKNFVGAFIRKVMQDDLLAPPSAVRGMTVLDRKKFQKTVKLPSLVVPVGVLKESKKILKDKIPDLQMKPVINCPNGDTKHKMVLLQPNTKLEDSTIEKLKQLGVENNFLYKQIDIGYEHFKPRDIFRAILPPGDLKDMSAVSPKGFSAIGHIIHLNLRAHQLPFKNIIGQVLLDKVPQARTVVNKVETISNEYRNLEMELLAGDNDFHTRLVEHGRIYEFDFSKVFFNSRLSTEHSRLSTWIPSTDTVFDVCAGIGPFSVPLAKKGCRVFANDLNPDCHRWLEHNAKLNKVKSMECFNLDGREFIKKNLRNFLLRDDIGSVPCIHVIMNLPAIAVEFLDAFPNLLPSQRNVPEVKVYFYIFATTPDGPKEEINSRVETHFGFPLPADADIRLVRNVAPTKDQYCVSFHIPKKVLFEKFEDDFEEPVTKKVKQ